MPDNLPDNPANQRDNVALIGFMGSGKSSVGRLLARLLRYRFVDLDQMIVRRDGREISRIFAEDGETFFRQQEHAALASLRQEEHLLIATGGGIVTREDNITMLRKMSFVVWLTATEEVIWDRVSRNDKRPLLQTPNPRETITKLLGERSDLYKQAAHFVIDTSVLPHGDIADAIAVEAQRFFSCNN